jgi:RNA polymerase sigma-70 factor (ECF subfamily)
MSQSFNQTLISHLPKLRNYALRLTRNASDADDLVQVTALLVLRAEAQFSIGTSFSAWSYRIMKNSFLSDCRGKQSRTVCIDDVSPELLTSHRGHADDHVLAHEVIRAVDKLPPTLRTALTVICGGELTYNEAAIALSCSIGTVKSRLWRARTRLNESLTNGGRNALASASHTSFVSA